MNTGLRPLSKRIPFTERARLMVKRGEAKTFGEACKMMRRPKVNPSNQTQSPQAMRLPYKD